MMNNKISKVADLLGVKFGEVFFIKEHPTYSRIYLKLTEKGIRQSFDKDSWSKASGWVWEQLITGALKINKLPWEPSYGDAYYMPSVVNSGKYLKLFWTGSEADKSSYQQGLVHRTKEEAIKLAEEMLDIARKRFAGNR